MDGNEEWQALLFGTGEDKMNLGSVRIRVEDLLNRIDSVIACLKSTSSAESKWKAGLDAYNLVNIHLRRLIQSAKPLMRNYVVCPVNFDPNAPEISDLLATQLHQEQEAKKKTIAEEMLNDDKELSKAIERIKERNELIMDLIQVSRKPGSGLLDPKGSTRKRRMAKSTEIRHEIRQFNEKHEWHSSHRQPKQQKRLAIAPVDAASGFGALTNGFLFGVGLKDAETSGRERART